MTAEREAPNLRRARSYAGRRHAAALSILLALFLLRVSAQLMQSVRPTPLPPPFEAWQSGTVPYGVLIVAQALIIAAVVVVILRLAHGHWPPRRNLGIALLALGAIYMGGAVFRLLAGMSFLSHLSFFHAPLPANVLVRIESPCGAVGLGEGCPRRYVTGETVETAIDFLQRDAAAILREAVDVESLRRWLRANRAEVDRHPSAFCALEMALLDLFARRAGVTLEEILGLPKLKDPLPVTAVYGSSSALAFNLQRWRFGRAGMRDAKLKLTGDRRDGARARSLARRGPLRLDANNLWPDARAAIVGLDPAIPCAWAVEEPIAPRDWAGMLAVAQATGLAIVLDESFTAPGDIAAVPEGARWIANVRVSKLGGVLRTLDAIDALQRKGCGVIIGAQVGETSLLARAGLLAAAAAGLELAGFEGAYGTHLLAYDVVRPSLTFDSRGKIMLASLVAPGWGLDAEPCLSLAFAEHDPPRRRSPIRARLSRWCW